MNIVKYVETGYGRKNNVSPVARVARGKPCYREHQNKRNAKIRETRKFDGKVY